MKGNMRTKNCFKRHDPAALCCVAILLTLSHSTPYSFAATKPVTGTLVKLPELRAAAQITRDTLGIAHIAARNEHDLFFLQGYVHAQDRLFQMDIDRRLASGTL